jgi:hypothetical protein
MTGRIAPAPQVAGTIQRYLQRLGAFLAPASVDAADNALRQFARWLITDAGLGSIGAVRRDDIEDYKVWLAAQPRAGGQAITAETHRQRLRTVRTCVLRADPASDGLVPGDGRCGQVRVLLVQDWICPVLVAPAGRW